MFWSKIWFFLVALVAAVGITVALVMPRPAERAHVSSERQRLAIACSVVGILLEDAARERVELASTFSRDARVVAALEEAGGQPEIDRGRADKLRDLATEVLRPRDGVAPDLAVLVDRKGRAVTRVGADAADFGDTVAGRPLVDDALAGYMRDDLWVVGDQLYLVAAAPVVQRDNGAHYVGAAVVGYKTSNKFAERLVSSLDVGIGFYVGGDRKAASGPTDFSKDSIVAGMDKVKGADYRADCQANDPFDLRAGSDSFTAVLARLPGEAQGKQAYYAIHIPRPKALGFAGTLGAVRSNDLSFGSFPWIPLGGALLVVLGIGIALMMIESDRPLRRLNQDALRLAKGELPRLSEEHHRGKFGSIARSVNIHVDKVAREAKAAKQDLDQLLGPAPDDALAAAGSLAGLGGGGAGFDLLAAPAKAVAPPPAEFRFSAPAIPVPTAASTSAPPAMPPGVKLATAAAEFALPPPKPAGTAPAAPPRPAPPRPLTPPPVRPTTPSPFARGIDDELDAPEAEGPLGDTPAESNYFKEVFSEFVGLKKTCGESIAGLTLAKFAGKLRKNRDDLRAKTGCTEVRFTVYVKDGKAALKATPVKAE